jgi:hypothetical protein
VAAAACVFLVASSVIAFNGWPGAGFADRVGNIFVNDEPAQVPWDRAGTAAVATGAGVAAGAVAAAPAGPTFGPGVLLAPDGTALRGRGGGGQTAGGIVATQSGGGGGTIPPVPPEPPDIVKNARTQLAGTVQGTGRGAGQAVRDTTSRVGGAVGGPVGDTVARTGGAVADTVNNVSNTAGSLLHP